MSDKPAEVSTQPKATAVQAVENPQITPEFLQELDSIPPGAMAGKVENLEQPKKESVVSAEKTAAKEGETEPEKTPETEVEAQPETETVTDPETTKEPETEEIDPEKDPAKEPEVAQVDPAKEPPEKPEDEPEDPKRIRLHLEKMTPLGKKVALLMRAGMDPDKAIVEAKAQLGITEKPADGKTTPAARPQEITSAEKALETAQDELAEAVGNFDKEAVKAATKKVSAAMNQVQEAKENARETQTHEKLVDASVTRATAEWPDAGSFATPLGEVVYSRLDRIAKDPSHPLHGDPDAPFKVTEQAATDLKIARKSAAKTAAPTTPSAKTVTPAPTRNKPASPVPGSARTTTQKPDLITAARTKAKEELGDDAALLDAAVPMLATK